MTAFDSGGIITVLFTDVVSSTELIGRLGEELAEKLRREHFRLLRDAVSAHGGQEVKSLGDGLMVVFASAVDACACAVAMQQGVDHHNRHADDELDVRVGLNVGEPIKDEGDYYGASVVIAKRLCDGARGGQILASELVFRLAGDRGATFRDAGEMSLKGIDRPEHAYEVVWEALGGETLPLPPGLLDESAIPFVGRDEELASLSHCLERVRTGGRHLVLIAGEPGIGKTRLAVELARSAHSAGAMVLAGRCDEDSVLPFRPFVEAIRHLVANRKAEELRLYLGSFGRLLVRLVPEIAERVPGLPDDSSSDTEMERFRLFESVDALLATYSKAECLVLVLDDLHWADKPTLALLRHVLRSQRDASLMVVGTYRDTDLSRTHPFAAFLADLRREQAAGERILLRGLSLDDVSELLRVTAEQELSDRDLAFARAVHEQTEGSPLFVREIWLHLIETGVIYKQQGRWVSDVASIGELGIPEGIREVIGRRLSCLSEAANAAISHAAVLGALVELDVLLAMTELGHEELTDLLEEALKSQLVSESESTRGPAYAFTHTLIRQTLYEELSLARRQRLHLKAAQAIEQARTHELDRYVGALALHMRAAGAAADAEQAIAYSVQAGEAAFRAYAYEEAATHLEAAVELMKEHDAGAERRGRLLERLGDMMYGTGTDPAKAIEYREDALGMYEEAGLLERAAQVRSRIGVHLSTVGGSPDLDIPGALEHFYAAEEILGRGPQRPAQGYFLVGLANALMRALRIGEALDVSQRAMDVAESLGSELLWANGALLQGWALFENGQLAAGRALAGRAWEVADRLDHAGLAFLCSWNRGNQANFLLDMPQAREWYGRELPLPRQAQAGGNRSMLLSNLAGAEVLSGRLAEGVELRRQSGSEQPPRAVGFFREVENDWEAIAQRTATSRDYLKRVGDNWGWLWPNAFICRIWRDVGDVAKASSLLSESVELAAVSGAVTFEMRLCIESAVAHAEAARLEEAESDIRRCREIRASGEDWRALAGSLSQAEALVTSDPRKAAAHFEQALETFRRFEVPFEEARALHQWGRWLLARNDQGAAAEKLEAAIDIYRRHKAGSRWIEFVMRDRRRAGA